MADQVDAPPPNERREEIDRSLEAFRQAQIPHRTRWLSGQQQPPRRLFHYTTLAGLQGIVSTNSFWASDVRFMNDASELKYAADLITDVIGEVQAVVTDPRLVSILPDRRGYANVFEFGERPFVACFCEQGDLLSQWRGYRAGEVGYSLGVDLHQASVVGSLPARTYLRKVIYEEDAQREWVRNIVESWIDAALTQLDDGAAPQELFPYPAIWGLQEALLELHLCFKHPTFVEEQEWRLIKLVDVREELRLVDDRRRESMLAATRERMQQLGVAMPEWPSTDWNQARAEGIEIKFRRTSIGLVPYVDLPVRDTAGIYTDRLPLVEVTHGPAPDANLSTQSLAMYLESQGYGFHTNLRTSTIPLRS